MDSTNVAIVVYLLLATVVGLITGIMAGRTGSFADGLVGGFFAGMFWPATVFAAFLKWIQSFKIWSM